MVYTSTPSRLANRTDDIMKFVASQGNAPINPFRALPYEFYEKGCMGKERTEQVRHKLIEVCDDFGIFGISKRTLLDLQYYLELRRIRKSMGLIVCVREFDPEWERYYERFLSTARFQRGLYSLKPYLYAS